MNVIGTAIVRFRAGTTVALVLTGEPVRTAAGYDDTTRGHAALPGRPGLVPIDRIGHGLWKERGT